MAPVVSLPEALSGDRQPLLPEPAHGLVTTREIVVAGRVFLGELAPHRRQPAGAKALEGPLDMVLPQFLDRQVHQATRPDSPAQIGQHAWPVFGGICCIASMVKTASNRAAYGRSCSGVR